MLTRRLSRGFTLPETIVAMTIAGIVLALVTSIALRQQRALADLADDSAMGQQLGDAHAIVPADLRAVAPAIGDVRDARDTAFEFRATIAAAVVCDTTATAIVLSPAANGATTFASITQSIEPGDTIWIIAPTDSSEEWTPSRITAVGSVASGQCGAMGPVLDASQRTLPRTTLTLASHPVSPIGLPARITRPARYSLYRASDGAWYAGLRDWNSTTLRFNTIQPVAGPFLSAAQNGLRFTYVDARGAVIPTPVAVPSTIAMVRLDLRAQTRNVRRALGAAGSPAHGIDSATAVVLFRNR